MWKLRLKVEEPILLITQLLKKLQHRAFLLNLISPIYKVPLLNYILYQLILNSFIYPGRI